MRSVLSPAVRKELLDLAGFHGTDSSEHIGKILDGVNVVAFARNDKRKVDGSRLSCGIRTDEQKVLPGKNKVFDSSLGTIVVDLKIWILEKSGESKPVLERVLDRLHERICRIERVFELQQAFVQFLDQRLGFPPPDCKSCRRRFVLDVSLYLVKLSVDVQNDFAQFVESSPGVRIATDFGFRTIFEQSIKTVSCIGLNKTAKVLEECFVLSEREIRRKNESIQGMLCITTANSHFAFAHGSSSYAILDFDRAVVGLDDVGSENFALQAFIQKFDFSRGGDEPVAEGRPGNYRIFPLEDLRLSEIGQSIGDLVNHGVRQKNWTRKSTRNRRTGLLCCDNVLPAAWAGSNFLLVLQAFNRMNYLFELVRKSVADKDSFRYAIRTDCIFRLDFMRNWLRNQVLKVDMLFVIPILWRLWLDRSRRRSCRSWVVMFCRWAVVFTVPLLFLHKQFIEFLLKIDKKFAQFGIAVKSVLELRGKLVVAFLEMFEDCVQLLSFFTLIRELLSKPQKFFTFGIWHSACIHRGIKTMIPVVVLRSRRSERTYAATVCGTVIIWYLRISVS